MCGVLQGPVLDPLFFQHMLPHGLDFHVFADDTQLCDMDIICDILPAPESNPDCCQQIFCSLNLVVYH